MAYFEQDVLNGSLTLERAAELWRRHHPMGHENRAPGWHNPAGTHQFSYSINSINLGGVDKSGNDASNELSYLILHMIGLLRMSSPTVV